MRSSFDGWARMLIRMDIGPWMLSRATVENFRIDSHTHKSQSLNPYALEDAHVWANLTSTF
jgi:hypothetical protein